MVMPECWIGAIPSAVIIVAGAVVLWFLSSRYFLLGIKIPGPPALPLIGNIIAVAASRRDIVGYFKELRDRYGPVVRLWVGPQLFVSLTDPKDVSLIFNSSKTLSRPVTYMPIKLVFGQSLITADVKTWKKCRRVMEPSFALHIIESYVGTFCEKSQVMADIMEERSDGRPFDVSGYTTLGMLDMVTETSLGVTTNVQSGHSQHCVVTNLSKLGKIVSSVILSPGIWIVSCLKFAVVYMEIVRLVEPLRVFVDTIIRQKSDGYTHSGFISGSLDTSDVVTSKSMHRHGFLENMITTMATNPGLMTSKELGDHVLFLMAAATDTSGFTVAQTLMLLGLHQDVQKKVMEEQEGIFGKDFHRTITSEDLKKMVYLEQVINETMRLYPIVIFIGRRVDEDVDISGYTLPAGTIVSIPIHVLHRDPNIYPDPQKFDPDRFSKENIMNRSVGSFVPFASGRRMCIGRRYAYMAMKTMLSVLLRRYQVLEYGSREAMEQVDFQFLLKLANGYNIKLRARE